MEEKMICRRAEIADLPEIMEIIDNAKVFMRAFDMDQWQNGYPNEEVFRRDIILEECYVAICDNETAGVMVVTPVPEECYKEIEGQGWLTDSEPYMSGRKIPRHKSCGGNDFFCGKFVYEEGAKKSQNRHA